MHNNEINILMLKDIKNIIPNISIKYFVTKQKNGFEIKNVPIFFTNYFNIIYNNLAYDFNELDKNYKKKYKKYYKRLKKIENDFYIIEKSNY